MLRKPVMNSIIFATILFNAFCRSLSSFNQISGPIYYFGRMCAFTYTLKQITYCLNLLYEYIVKSNCVFHFFIHIAEYECFYFLFSGCFCWSNRVVVVSSARHTHFITIIRNNYIFRAQSLLAVRVSV